MAGQGWLVRVPSSPPFFLKNLPKVLHFRAGTKRHKIGTGNRVFPSRAYVSCVFSRNKSATTACCAFRFSVVTACVYVSRVTRIVEWRSSSCMIFSSAPVELLPSCTTETGEYANRAINLRSLVASKARLNGGLRPKFCDKPLVVPVLRTEESRSG